MIENLYSGIKMTSPLEWLAFCTSLVYVFLASRKSSWCWIFAFISSVAYVYICFSIQLYADTALQVFYALMALWGWWNWGNTNKNVLVLQTWTFKKNALLCLFSALTGFILGFLLHQYTDQAFPYIDAQIFCFSIAATYLISQKVLENWIYFVVIDLIAFPLFWSRGVYVTALLYLFFTILAVWGWLQWRKSYKLQIR